MHVTKSQPELKFRNNPFSRNSWVLILLIVWIPFIEATFLEGKTPQKLIFLSQAIKVGHIRCAIVGFESGL